MLFRPFQEEDFAIVESAQAQTQYNGSEYSRIYLKGWDFFNFKTMQIAQEGDAVYLRFLPHPRFSDSQKKLRGYWYLPPLCPIDQICQAFDRLAEFVEEEEQDLYVSSVPEEYASLLNPERYRMSYHDNNSEYLYDPQDLITLKGKKYHAKRNHVNKFVQTYGRANGTGYVFRPYQAQDREGVFELLNDWQQSKTFDEADAAEESEEASVIRCALDLSEKCGSCGGRYYADLIEYDGKIIAFSCGEITPSNVGIVHIEKGDIEYDGVYPALNQMFAAAHFENVRLINRQEDMGIEGLRKSKQSYYPCGFSKKYAVTLNESVRC